MPTLSHVDPRAVLNGLASEDLYGHDRMAKAFLRTILRLKSGSAVAVHGAPGSGKNQFLLRCAWLLQAERHTIGFDPTTPSAGVWCWYNPWLYQKHGNILAGLVATMAHHATDRAALDRARDIVGHINRMHFGEDMPESAGTGIQRGDLNPIERVRQGFVALCQLLKQSADGRVLVFIEDMDMLSPSARLLLFEGLRLLATPESDVTFVLSVGRESALESMRVREPGIGDQSAAHCLAELLDLSITVPGMDIRRISLLLRKHIGSEQLVKKAFGNDAIDALSHACASRPLGMPRFLERLAGRITLLAEFAVDTRSSRELSEAQWAWVIISERWPDFRRFMLRGGRDRWGHLRHALGGLSSSGAGFRPDADPTMVEWLQKDLIFADYLRIYAEEFEREADAVYWLETLQLACGL
jgi:hypothetical protein